MFVPAKIKLNELQLFRNGVKFDIKEFDKQNQEFYQKLLKCVTDFEGNINGSNLQKLVFPFEDDEYDIFLSHSHKDLNEILPFYFYLKSKGLKVFLDDILWNNAKKLLWEIDKSYSKSDIKPDLIDYEKSLYSSEHVHAMLSMALLEAIDRSELCLFIESPNSTTIEQGIKNYTLSPWIYEELSFISKIVSKIPCRFKNKRLLESCFSEGTNRHFLNEGGNIHIQYSINMKNLKTLKGEDFKSNSESTQILNDIYLNKFRWTMLNLRKYD